VCSRSIEEIIINASDAAMIFLSGIVLPLSCSNSNIPAIADINAVFVKVRFNKNCDSKTRKAKEKVRMAS
jgi:hypothetical protein